MAVDWLTGGLGVEIEGAAGAVELGVDEADVVAVEEGRGGAIGGA